MTWLCCIEAARRRRPYRVLQLTQVPRSKTPPGPDATQHIESTSKDSPQEGNSASDVSVWTCALKARLGRVNDVVNSEVSGVDREGKGWEGEDA
jgi:hypothetical protein